LHRLHSQLSRCLFQARRAGRHFSLHRQSALFLFCVSQGAPQLLSFVAQPQCRKMLVAGVEKTYRQDRRRNQQRREALDGASIRLFDHNPRVAMS
jgi:hypothetical protein